MNLLSETATSWPDAALGIAAALCFAACMWALAWMSK